MLKASKRRKHMICKYNMQYVKMPSVFTSSKIKKRTFLTPNLEAPPGSWHRLPQTVKDCHRAKQSKQPCSLGYPWTCLGYLRICLSYLKLLGGGQCFSFSMKSVNLPTVPTSASDRDRQSRYIQVVGMNSQHPN